MSIAQKKTAYFQIFLLLSLLALPLVAWGMSGFSGLQDSAVRAEADKVFAYDRAHPHVLPAHLLRSLSLTVAFYDDAGAHKLIQDLRRLSPENF
jgi:hypothetical protein